MNAAQNSWTPAERRRVATAAARAYVTMAERSGREVPQWIRDAAAGRPTTPPHEPPNVAAAPARASIALRERWGREVPQWIRDAAAGRPTTPPPEHS